MSAAPAKRKRGFRSASHATDEDLRPYGYRPGTVKRWCAACEKEWRGLAPNAFKCRPCAEKQFADVEALCPAKFGAKK